MEVTIVNEAAILCELLFFGHGKPLFWFSGLFIYAFFLGVNRRYRLINDWIDFQLEYDHNIEESPMICFFWQ